MLVLQLKDPLARDRGAFIFERVKRGAQLVLGLVSQIGPSARVRRQKLVLGLTQTIGNPLVVPR